MAIMDLKQILLQPIPDFTGARKIKAGYRDHPFLKIGTRDNEPLVAIDEYGIAGQSYYSRPNAATDRPVPGVDSAIYVRKSIAEKLAAINYELQNSAVIQELFGRKVELYVDEGYRSPELQEKLYNEVFPRLIRDQHPGWSERQVLKRRDELSAKPPTEGAPSPHATGAAIDVKLRFQHENLGYAAGLEVSMGHADANTSGLTNPDYYESGEIVKFDDRDAQKNRRIFYWTMRGALLGDDSGFVVNPTEWWHWSYGDQMWAKLTYAPGAFYGQADAAHRS
jgi:D-alanyl-D-alanine dipeptidase